MTESEVINALRKLQAQWERGVVTSGEFIDRTYELLNRLDGVEALEEEEEAK